MDSFAIFLGVQIESQKSKGPEQPCESLLLEVFPGSPMLNVRRIRGVRPAKTWPVRSQAPGRLKSWTWTAPAERPTGTVRYGRLVCMRSLLSRHARLQYYYDTTLTGRTGTTPRSTNICLYNLSGGPISTHSRSIQECHFPIFPHTWITAVAIARSGNCRGSPTPFCISDTWVII